MTDEPTPNPCRDMRARHREHQRAYLREYRRRPEVRERRQRPEIEVRERQRRTPWAAVTCVACGRTAPPAETETGGVLICMWCGSTAVKGDR